MRIAILSDTHNLLRPELPALLGGCGAILHGGDVSRPDILTQLRSIAPVYAVRGNNDKAWPEELPLFLEMELAGLRVFMTHKKKDLPDDLSMYDLVVYGHSHQYAESWLSPVCGRRTLLLNPGSCGPRRFNQPITLAMLQVDDSGFTVRRVDLHHAQGEKTAVLVDGDVRAQIEQVIRETERGRSPAEIARRTGMDEALAEQIARLHLTHPGVTPDGIMTKMGL